MSRGGRAAEGRSIQDFGQDLPTKQNENLIPDDVIAELQAEARRAHGKHGDRSLLGDGLTDIERLAALVEEVGEAAGAMTYDKDVAELEDELFDAANVALSWVTWLRRKRREFEADSWAGYSGKEGV